jgi:hypothetical protein
MATGGSAKLSGGNSTQGDGGNTIISSGTSSSGTGGFLFLSGGAGGSVGGSVVIAGGAGNSSAGSIIFNPGNAIEKGSVQFADPSSLSVYSVVSDSTIQFSASTTVSVDASGSGTISLTAGSTITLSGGSGVSMGDSYVYGFEIGTGSVGTLSPSEVELNKMAGSIMSQTTNLGAGSIDTFTVYNNRVFSYSVVLVTIGNSSGCTPVVQKAVPTAGQIAVQVINISSLACTASYQVNFMVVS